VLLVVPLSQGSEKQKYTVRLRGESLLSVHHIQQAALPAGGDLGQALHRRAEFSVGFDHAQATGPLRHQTLPSALGWLKM
jgi:hypothetical protein